MPKPRPRAEKIEVTRMALRLSMVVDSADCSIGLEVALTVGIVKKVIAETAKIIVAFVAKFNDFLAINFSCCFFDFCFDLLCL